MTSAAALLLVLALMAVCSYSQGREFVHDMEVDLAEEMERGGGGREEGVAEEENNVIPLNSPDNDGSLGYMKQLSTSQTESDVTAKSDYCGWFKWCRSGTHCCKGGGCCKNGQTCCDGKCCASGAKCTQICGATAFGTYCIGSKCEWKKVTADSRKFPAISMKHQLEPQSAVTNQLQSEVSDKRCYNGKYCPTGQHCCNDDYGGCCDDGNRCCYYGGQPKCCYNKRHGVASPRTYPVIERELEPQSAVTNQLQSEQATSEAKLIKPHSWSDCGSSHAVAKVNYLTLNPDPVQLPGPISVTFSVSINHTVDAPLKMEVQLERHTEGTWQEVLSTYHDVCDFLSGTTCPAAFVENNIPCACPFKEGTYTLPLTSYTVTWSPPSGEYRATVRLTQGGNTPVACVELEVTVA